MIYTREQLIHEISEIIKNNIHDHGDWVDHESAAKEIADLIVELNTEAYCEGFQDS